MEHGPGDGIKWATIKATPVGVPPIVIDLAAKGSWTLEQWAQAAQPNAEPAGVFELHALCHVAGCQYADGTPHVAVKRWHPRAGDEVHVEIDGAKVPMLTVGGGTYGMPHCPLCHGTVCRIDAKYRHVDHHLIGQMRPRRVGTGTIAVEFTCVNDDAWEWVIVGGKVTSEQMVRWHATIAAPALHGAFYDGTMPEPHAHRLVIRVEQLFRREGRLRVTPARDPRDATRRRFEVLDIPEGS